MHVRYIRFALFLILVASVSVATLITACGRRGDPVPLVPRDISTETVGKEKERSDGEVSVGSEKEVYEAAPKAFGIVPPDPPQGLVAVFSQPVIILSWDEMPGQNIRFYKVYRASEKGYTFVGRTISTAFTDMKVKSGTTYRYRVSAVGNTEGPMSGEVGIETPALWE
jgi:hypothetical protein